MKDLKLKATLIKDGIETHVGFKFNIPLTKKDFIKNAQLLIASHARKLEIDGEFS